MVSSRVKPLDPLSLRRAPPASSLSLAPESSAPRASRRPAPHRPSLAAAGFRIRKPPWTKAGAPSSSPASTADAAVYALTRRLQLTRSEHADAQQPATAAASNPGHAEPAKGQPCHGRRPLVSRCKQFRHV